MFEDSTSYGKSRPTYRHVWKTMFIWGKLEVSCISKLKAFKLRNVTPKFVVKRKVWFRSLWVVCFLILDLKCNLIYTELFEESAFIFEAQKLNLLWIGVELAWKKKWRLYIFPQYLGNLTLQLISNYYTLNYLTLFWLAESIQWIFKISALDVVICYTIIIISRTLKITGTCNHVKFTRFVLLPVSEEAKTWLPFFDKPYRDLDLDYSGYHKNPI